MKALIAMSGGVDSSVAAALTIEQGYECIGCNMKLFDAVTEKSEKSCCSLDDVEDARSVARKLNMPFYVFNFKDGFKEKVIDNFINCYLCGRTPNPCIECNRYMKFDKLYERMKELNCDKIVTGHYAIVEKAGDSFVLRKSKDLNKDQSYVLFRLNQELLSHILFPLGALSKEKARKIAEMHGFFNAHKAESQDICFVPDGDYGKVIEAYTGKKSVPGNFVDLKGNVLGTHEGVINYTIGQRKGLKLAMGKPVYVCAIDVARNEVVLGDNEDLFGTVVYSEDNNWIAGGEIPDGLKCSAKVRYRMAEKPGTIFNEGNGRLKFVFDEPVRAITPGQSIVFYDGDIVLGGGTIV
ncbi:MAG: tRNA 2-thiouridine(34) synthase MnmA [Lachnospiraceae bacterium]|nr:tRNA 2-thiouridine(34) synthase MnmA [Lachnospiraceae bacterium]